MTKNLTTHQPVAQKKAIKPDYLKGEPALQPFYQYGLQQPDFGKIMQDKAFPERHRKVLHQALTAQYQGLPVTSATQRNIDALLDENTFSLTTGHQLNLFGGPLYTPYKVLTVIKLAESLSQSYPDQRVVPVFWIHTEDHDFEEINHFYPNFHTKKTYGATFTGATGHHVLTDEITDLIPDHFSDELKACYTPGITLAEATLRFANILYGKYGLIILDADRPELKGLFAEMVHQELTDQVAKTCVEKVSDELRLAGYPAQINPRGVNLFYLDEAGRNRIEEVDEGFRIVGTEKRFSSAELLAEVNSHPERFSPNVALRPLYQETILPNLAYCGGWGEISYWLQLRGVFDHFKINFPLLLPRMSAVIFREKELVAWRNLGLEPDWISLGLHDLYKRFMPHIWQSDEFVEKAQMVHQAFEELQTYIETLSPTLPRSVEGQKVKTGHFLETLEKKIHRVIRNQTPEPFAQIDRLKAAIQPEGMVQERVLSLAAFPEINPEHLIQQVWEKCDPLSFTQQQILLKEI